MHIAKASIQPSRPRQLKPCVGSPSSSFCRRVIDDESFVGIKRSMSRTFVFFPFLSFSLSNCQFVEFLGAFIGVLKVTVSNLAKFLSLNLCFLVG